MAVLLLALVLQAPNTSAADFTGIDGFWSIADRLVAGADVPAAAWDSLFDTPGYRALEARERRRADLELGMRLALAPSEALRLDSLLAFGGWAARVARHIGSVVERRAELAAFRDSLERRDVLAAALRQTATLLPPNAIERFGTPAVAFIFFLPDGRGYPGLVIADLAHSAGRPDLDAYLAHEAAHFYYAALASERRARQPEPTPAQQAVHVLLSKLFEESFGDQFDKAPWFRDGAAPLRSAPLPPERRDWLEEYFARLQHAGTTVGEIDAALAAAAADPARLRAVADSINAAIPLEGRPVGFMITAVIRRVLGDAALVQTLGDPIAWLRAYQRAASSPECTSCVPLSERLAQALFP